jgi:hypothetical protein
MLIHCCILLCLVLVFYGWKSGTYSFVWVCASGIRENVYMLADLALNRFCFSPVLTLGLKQRKATMAQHTKREVAKARRKPIKRMGEIASKCKATKELRARHFEGLCAEVESLRGANSQIPRRSLSQILSLSKGVYTWLTIDILNESLPGDSIKDTTIVSGQTDGTLCLQHPPSNYCWHLMKKNL